MLKLSRYSKKYNGSLILEVPELDLQPGIYWIKGENGSGKSTLFKSIGGLLPFEGNILLNTIDIKKNALEYRRQVNYAEAEPLYPGFLTAKDLIRFVGKMKRSSVQQQESLTSIFGIDTFFQQPCETYSSGMTKKLSLAMAFLGSPKLIILDEPLITLDESARNVLMDMIARTSAQGTMFLLSSHQLLDDLPFTLTRSYCIKNKTLALV